MQIASFRRVKYRRLECVQLAGTPSETSSSNLASHLSLQLHPAALISALEPQPGCGLLAKNSQLQSLPQHLLDKMLDGLPPDDLMIACQVCKVWHDLIKQDCYKCKRLAWHHKSFVQPGSVANFRTKRRWLSYTAERRLNELTDSVGKTMLLQF